MEPKNLNTEDQVVKVETKEQRSNLHEVTSFSKYLAMALFIILPFIGGYIGYKNAPEKVVEVKEVLLSERDITQESVVDFINQEGIYILHTDRHVTYITIENQVFALWNFGANVGDSLRLEILPNVAYSSPSAGRGVSVIETAKVPLLVNLDDVYYRADLLEGLSAQDMSIREDGFVLHDGNTVYVIDSNCRDWVIREGSVEEIDSFQPSC